MHSGFTRMISALWDDVNLGEPTFEPDGSIIMDLDAYKVELSPSDDGRHILAAITIGPLSEDPAQLNSEAEALLRLSLLSMTANRGGISIDEQDGASFAVIRGACLCEIGLIHRLSDVIADVVYLADECRQIIGGASVAQARNSSPPANTIPVVEDGIIFMP